MEVFLRTVSHDIRTALNGQLMPLSATDVAHLALAFTAAIFVSVTMLKEHSVSFGDSPA